MQRYTLLFILLLSAINMARGQTAYDYRYWFDSDDANIVAGQATGEAVLTVDASRLPAGMHALRLQATKGTDKGWSSVNTQFFLRTFGTTGVKAQYWYDNDITTLKSLDAANGTLNLDISPLSTGLHAIHYQSIGSDGLPSAVATQFFINAQGDKGVNAIYWYDNDSTVTYKANVATGAIDLNIQRLNVGIHAIHYQTFAADGTASSVHTQFFLVDQVQIGTLSACIWFDDDTGKAASYELTEESIVLDISKLRIGTHLLNVTLVDSHNLIVGQYTEEFEVLPRMKTITLTAELMTFSCDEDLNFQGVKGLRAYTAAGFNRKTSDVIMHRVNDVPAYTGLLLSGKAGTTYQVPCEESPTVYVNMLEAVPEATTLAAAADGYWNYVLAMENGTPMFVQAVDSTTVAAEGAYLRIPAIQGSDASRLNILIVSDVPGDVNNDYNVDVADIATVISVMAGGSGIADPLQQTADVNGDGVVDVADIAAVISIMAANARLAGDMDAGVAL